MSVFDYIFGKTGNQISTDGKINWIPLTSIDQLDEIISVSDQKPSVIFKHSTRCSISRMALKRFESEYDVERDVATYFLDLLEHRDISNEIVDRFGVLHQSPQLILIKEGQAVYDASHEAIDAGALKGKL
jgi:bacillithiol system protein YtxJ